MKAWAVEFRENFGEGRLARLILNQYPNVSEVRSYHGVFTKNLQGESWVLRKPKTSQDRDIDSLRGMVWSAIFALSSRKDGGVFINFCPIWNIAVFAFCSKKFPLYVTGQDPYQRFSGSTLGCIFYATLSYLSRAVIILRGLDVKAVNPYVMSFLRLKRFEIYELLKEEFENRVIHGPNLCRSKNSCLRVLVYISSHPAKRSKVLLQLLSPLVNQDIIQLHTIGDPVKKIADDFGIRNKGFVDHGRVTLDETHRLMMSLDLYVSIALEETSITLLEATHLCSTVIFSYSPILDEVHNNASIIKFDFQQENLSESRRILLKILDWVRQKNGQ